MKHFPIFVAVEGRRIIVSGGGETAIAKLRLLLKTEATISVFAADPDAQVLTWAAEGRLSLTRRALVPGDIRGATLVYAAEDNPDRDASTAEMARAEGALVNIVDNLADSQFITPAIVDRDPVTIAIGTEGAAPVLARAIKADLEARLSPVLGRLAAIGKAFRHRAEALPMGRARRQFWRSFYFGAGPRAHAEGGDNAVLPALDALLSQHIYAKPETGRVDLVGAGPGDPELLTLKARAVLDRADIVIYDRLVAPEILELARREAMLINVGKEGFGPSTAQTDINDLMIAHAKDGAHVVRLKSGDPTVFGRLDEEIEACEQADVAWSIVPGITAASASVAAIGQSLTRRDRNGAVRLLTGHDVKGFAEHDWRSLARPGEVAAIYMGKKTSRFLQGRLMMHGAALATPVTIIENASRPDQQIIAATLADLAETINRAALTGPALMIYGLAPRAAEAALPLARQKEAN